MAGLSNYFVTYTLADPEKNAKAIADEIVKIGRAGMLMPAVWYLRTSFTEGAIRDRLRALMSQFDQVLVIAAGNAVGFGLDVDLWQAVKAEWNAALPPATEPAKPVVTQ